MPGVFCVQGSIGIGDGEIAGGGTEGDFTRGIGLAILDGSAHKPIGDEGIVRGTALQGQGGLAKGDLDVDILSTGQHTDGAVPHGKFGIEFRCGQMVNVTAAHGKIKICILHS